MMSSWFDPSLTLIWPQKSWTSPFYGSMNVPSLKTLLLSCNLSLLTHHPPIKKCIAIIKKKKKKKWIHSITVLHTIWTHLNLQIYKHVSDFKPKLRIDMGELDFDVVHAKQRSWVSSILKELWKQTIKKIGTVHGVFNDKICCTSFGLKSKMY